MYQFCISVIVVFTVFASAQNTNSISITTSATIEKTTVATTKHPTVKTLRSNLCKICNCRMEISGKYTLDCSHKNKTSLFNADEWDTLKYGDIEFETIALNDNRLTEVEKFESISVKRILLNNNKIANISSRAFEELANLEEINLENNKLTSKELTPDVFQGKYSPTNNEPLNVKILNLAYNDLHSLNPNLFEHFPQLEALYLNNNKFDVIDHLTATAISIATLKIIDLSYMGLKTLPEHIFHSPRDLEEIRLSGNLFNHIPDALQYAINIKTLFLDDLNFLEDLGKKNLFPSLLKLESLHLSYCSNLATIGVNALNNLQNLKKIYLTNNPKLVFIDTNAFAHKRNDFLLFDFPPLEEIYLHNNNLTVLDRTIIERWDRVKVIDLRKNPWQCTCENDFLINILPSQIIERTPNLMTEIKCNTPKAWFGLEIKEIYDKKKTLKCHDENNPESDGHVLMGTLIGLLIGIPIAFAILLIFKRGCFGLRRNDPARYSRAFYSRTQDNEYL